MLAGDLLTPVNQGIQGRLPKTSGIIRVCIRAEQQIGLFLIRSVFLITMQGDDLPYDIPRGIYPLQLFQVASTQIYANNDIRPHIPCDIRRIVILDPTIYQHHAIQTYRCEHGRNRHTGTHSQRKTSMMENIFLAVHHIQRHTSERYIQLIEVHGIMIADR